MEQLSVFSLLVPIPIFGEHLENYSIAGLIFVSIGVVIAMSDIYKIGKGLKKAGAIDKTTMRQFDTLCLTSIHDFTPEQVKKLRLANNLSQPVFAQYLNVSDKLVKKWEQGESKPRGAALKMLSLVERRGIEVLA